ncbi:MAG TPA: protealysin inhibitor emfourin [Thermoleophilaceae bacterium]|jgi:hypothetical protein
MKVSVVRGGGLAGLVTRTAVEADALDPEHAGELRSRVERAGVLDMPEEPPAGERGPDELAYSLTVEADGRERTVRMPEHALPDSVRELIDWIDAVPGREESIGPPGGGPPRPG